MEILVLWFEKNKFKPNKNDVEYQQILEHTTFLHGFYPKITLKQRIWHLRNNDFEIQRCKICGKPTAWYDIGAEYRNFCTKECRIKYSKSDEWKQKLEQTSLKKYGAKNHSQTYQAKASVKQTFLNKYGNECYFRTDDWKNKTKQTKKQKYGDENYSNQDKIIATMRERYGSHYFQTDELKEKSRQTCLKKYGQDSYSKTDEFKEKQIRDSTWFDLLKQGIGGAVYVRHIDGNLHLLECKICGQNFEHTTHSKRIHQHHTLCPQCNPIEKAYSNVEKDLLLFIQSIYSGPIQENSRSVIPPYELDIFIPELSLAFEFNGLYYHSDLHKPDNYHKTKTELCEQAGIRLVHIFEDDWNFKQEIVKSIISNMICPQNNQKIQARKCQIREVNLSETNDFLEQYHIQGGILTQTVCYGLYYERKLVSLMSFKKNKDGFELQRYGILLGHTIVGGAEKLFTHFVQTHNPEFVITYADISLFTGKVYQKLGFTKVRRNKPNYMFVDGDVRIPKQSIRKLGQGYKRENDPYPRIYNCGIDKWLWK